MAGIHRAGDSVVPHRRDRAEHRSQDNGAAGAVSRMTAPPAPRCTRKRKNAWWLPRRPDVAVVENIHRPGDPSCGDCWHPWSTTTGTIGIGTLLSVPQVYIFQNTATRVSMVWIWCYYNFSTSIVLTKCASLNTKRSIYGTTGARPKRPATHGPRLCFHGASRPLPAPARNDRTGWILIVHLRQLVERTKVPCV